MATGEPVTPFTVVDKVLAAPDPETILDTVVGGSALAGTVTPDGRGPGAIALVETDPGVRQAIVCLQSHGAATLGSVISKPAAL